MNIWLVTGIWQPQAPNCFQNEQSNGLFEFSLFSIRQSIHPSSCCTILWRKPLHWYIQNFLLQRKRTASPHYMRLHTITHIPRISCNKYAVGALRVLKSKIFNNHQGEIWPSWFVAWYFTIPFWIMWTHQFVGYMCSAHLILITRNSSQYKDYLHNQKMCIPVISKQVWYCHVYGNSLAILQRLKEKHETRVNDLALALHSKAAYSQLTQVFFKK